MLLLTACYQAPLPDGPDQIYDPNVHVTAQKDASLAVSPAPDIDDVMWTAVDDDDVPGCAVGVSYGDELRYLQGYGLTELGGDNWSVGTVGAVGSVAKTVTATAVLRMYDLGWLDVNDPIGDWMDVSGDLANIAIYRLLTHEAGYGGTTAEEAFSPDWEASSPPDTCDADCDDVSAAMASPFAALEWYDDATSVETLSHPPDEDGGGLAPAVYSNSGYSALGALVDSIAQDQTGQGYEEWIWNEFGGWDGDLSSSDHVLSKALIHSWRASDIPGRAIGYTRTGTDQADPASWAAYEAWEPAATGGYGGEGWEGPSGGWAFTIGDLARFNLRLNRGDWLEANTLAAMRNPFSQVWGDTSDETSDYFVYGFGTAVDEAAGSTWHGGDIGGHHAVWGWWPDLGDEPIGVSIICNNDTTGMGLYNVAGLVADAVAAGALDDINLSTWNGSRVPTRGMATTVHRLSFENATFDPAGGIAAEFLTHDLLLQVGPADTRGSRLVFYLAEGSVVSGRARVASGRPTVRLGYASTTSNPWFTSGAADVSLETDLGTLTLRDIAVTVGLADRGTTLGAVSFTGTVDFRDFSSLGVDPADACGRNCVACDDGAEYCVDVTVDSVAGEAVAGRLSR